MVIIHKRKLRVYYYGMVYAAVSVERTHPAEGLCPYCSSGYSLSADTNRHPTEITGTNRSVISKYIEELSKKDNWPSSETSAIWKVFRDELLKSDLKKWRRTDFMHKQLAAEQKNITDGYYRFEIDEANTAWMTTPDFVKISPFKRSVAETGKGLTYISYKNGDKNPHIIRFGEGRLNWFQIH